MMERPRKVLIVDDEAIVCERLRAPLERVGFEVETFTDSQAALERLLEERFEVLVTDLKMRRPDGLDMLRTVRERSPRTHVIVITGFPTVDAAREAMKGGAVDFIPKPFKISQLRDLVLEVCERKPGE
jgi:DNA-binding NtrC family response regulator